jgi:hypothetical protein
VESRDGRGGERRWRKERVVALNGLAAITSPRASCGVAVGRHGTQLAQGGSQGGEGIRKMTAKPPPDSGGDTIYIYASHNTVFGYCYVSLCPPYSAVAITHPLPDGVWLHDPLLAPQKLTKSTHTQHTHTRFTKNSTKKVNSKIRYPHRTNFQVFNARVPSIRG